MRIAPKNWRDFQHYKDRNPPWIRLHRKLLDDKEFHRLPDASRALAPMLWLLASESIDGSINADADDLAFRLRRTEQWVSEALKPLMDAGFFVACDVVEQAASTPLAEREQVAVPETEALQSQRQRQIPAAPAPHPKRKPQKTDIPADFAVSERVRIWAAGKGFGQLAEHLDAFKRKVAANGYVYADWDSAFMEAVRMDWAKLRGGKASGPAPPPEPKADDSAQRWLAEQAVRAAEVEAQRQARLAARKAMQ